MSSLSNTKPKGTNFYRTEKKTKQLKVLNSGKAKRNAKGEIIKEAIYQSKLPSGTRARVEPNRKWFENTRTISSKELLNYDLATQVNNPFEYVIRSKQLPVELIQQPKNIQPKNFMNFKDVFGPNQKRKRPNISQTDYNELATNSSKRLKDYDSDNDNYDKVQDYQYEKNPIFQKGQSKRIWGELYKVIDSSDVLIHVLDARDPLGTRCENVINHLKTLRHKQLVFVLNKVDLVPTWVTERWKSYLEKEYPTVAFHANINNPFGKSSLINLLRQFSKLHSDKKQISIGLVGYPNTGKSSIINTLKQKKVCNVAPIPGETRVWQYVALMKRIYLIDCPGIVYGSKNDSETDIILKGVVRVENVEYCQEHIQAVIDKVRKEYLLKTYNLQDFTDSHDFLTQIAVKSGKLLKGGEPDENTIAKMVLNDWVRGKIPFYNLPPDYEDSIELNEENERLVRVNQRTQNIKITSAFMPEDIKDPMKNLENPDDIENIEFKELEENQDVDDANANDADASWNEVFNAGSGSGSEIESDQESTKNNSEDSESFSESCNQSENSDSENLPNTLQNGSKTRRMTTNKKKATNYYTNANVKNKNKSKKGKVNFKK